MIPVKEEHVDAVSISEDKELPAKREVNRSCLVLVQWDRK
jgi:hypothetical protein